MTTNNGANNTSSSDLERAFSAIEKGKSEESSGRHWEAADSFGQARQLLHELASHQGNGNDEEQAKIAKLYEDQSYEYLHRTREALMEGLKAEHEQDLQTNRSENPNGTRKYACEDLSLEDSKKRIQLFASVFAKKDAVTEEAILPVAASEPPSNQTDTTTKSNDNQQAEGDEKPSTTNQEMSLEERLQQLNANLPKSLKSSQERLQDINKGMDRLGFSLPVAPLTFKMKPPKSSSQQVADIIAQATDEVALENALGNHDTEQNDDDDNVSHDDSIPSDDDDDNDLHSDADSLLSDENPVLQNVSQIRDQVASAQAKLAELSVLLEQLSADEGEDEEQDKETKNDAAAFDPAFGKQKLQDAKQSIRKALRLWKVKAA